MHNGNIRGVVITMSDSAVPEEVVSILKRYKKILVPIMQECTEHTDVMNEVLERFGQQTA